ncbi:MAG TPA: protease modulator HflC [Myxococcota bacterium]|nr:protease modulator HflC [Myxococcota bacterium]
MKKYWLLAALVLVVLSIYSAAFQVSENRSAVVTRFGKPVRQIDEAGLHWKFPAPIERATIIDRRIKLLRPPGLELLTADKRNIVAEVFIAYQIEDAVRYLTGAGSEMVAEAHLVDLALAHLGAWVGQKEFSSFLGVKGQAQVIKQIVEKVTAAVDDKAKAQMGITIRRIGFRRLIFPPQNVASVIRRMKAEREKIARRYRSEGTQKAMEIEAEAETEKGKILAEATEKSLKIRAGADAESARIYSKSYSQDPELFRFLKTLETSEAVLKKKSTVVIPYDSSFLDPLFRGGG